MLLKPKEIANGRGRSAVLLRDTGSTASGPDPIQKNNFREEVREILGARGGLASY
ncbi:MAG TPA: hypothetical protein VNE42_01040 [Acidimicrobiales bacterium]|nr:hypothetical protein [Acidimicrobiales bacterium]